jgi:hypothetical protein
MAVAAGFTPPRFAVAVAPVRAVPVPALVAAPTPEEICVAVLLKPEDELLFEGGLFVVVCGVLGAVGVRFGGVNGWTFSGPVAPLVCAVMLVEPVLVEPEPLEVELPEPEVDPTAAPGVALPPAQTTPGLLSGSWLVVPLLPEPSVPWLPSPAGFWVTQVPPVPEPSVPEPLVSVPEPVVPVPEPVVSVPEPVVSVPEPLVPVPDPLSPGTVLLWPLFVVPVLSVGFVVVPVGVLSVGFVVVPVGVLPVGFVVVPVGVLPVS